MRSGAHVFVYGTLLDPTRLEAVLEHKHQGERLAARLHGYRRVSTPSYPYPFAVAEPGSAIDGTLVMDVSPYDLDQLDRYEEVEAGIYRREMVQVEAWGCGPRPCRLEAAVYLAGDALLALSGLPNRERTRAQPTCFHS